MAIGEVRILDEDVFRRTIDTQAIGVLAGLDGYAIVVDVDIHVVDAHMLRGVDIDAVRAGDVVLGGNPQVLGHDVFAVQKEQAPDRLVVEVETSHMHLFGILDADEPRPPTPG